MTPALEQLVQDVMDATGADRPGLLADDSPILADAAMLPDEDAFYLVGLIGGKDVGKSALVNALVGRPITAVTSTGAGTEIVVAYAHASQVPSLKTLLEREAPGEHRIVTHDLAPLRRQVLLDLPDIDSRYASHPVLTRKMLRHTLYPLWVGSIEKYADQQPQTMLARVADGNNPGNFVFCLNKVDQINEDEPAPPVEDEEDSTLAPDPDQLVPMPWGLDLEDEPSPVTAQSLALQGEISTILGAKVDREVRSALDELRADYAARLGRTLRLDEPPRVYMISAKYPLKYEMPALRQVLSQEKAVEVVRESKHLAAARQEQGLLAWLDGQDLPGRAERLGRLQRDAEELLASRVVATVVDRIVPRLLDDPATQFAMADDVLQERVARWPIVNLIHTLVQPVFVLLRSAVAREAAPMQGPLAMVGQIIAESGQPLGRLVQSTFALLRQAQPVVAPLFRDNRLWEDMPADLAAHSLQVILSDTVQRQRETARARLLGRSILLAPVRWLLTLGALVWFPFLQPMLSLLLMTSDNGRNALWPVQWPLVGRLVVQVLGVNYFLTSAGFLLIYYAAIWLALRWNTQRKAARVLAEWRAADFPEPSLNLGAQTVGWMESLIAPISTANARMMALAERADKLRAQSA